MGKTALMTDVEVLNAPIDVLYLTGQAETIPPEVKRLLKQKKLSYAVLDIDKFPQILHQVDLVGTVIIDAKDLGVCQQQKLARIIESLEMKNIGAILLNNRAELAVRSFSLAGPQVKSFSLVTSMQSVLIDELWLRISVNLAYRKRNSEIVIKPAGVPARVQTPSYNSNLEEQLTMTGTLVTVCRSSLAWRAWFNVIFCLPICQTAKKFGGQRCSCLQSGSLVIFMILFVLMSSTLVFI